jgi:hypothetical protein
MAIKPESQFIKSVHAYLGGLYFMKNHNEYVAGVPDVWYSGTTRDLWVEYKYKAVKTFRNLIVPDLSALQLSWIRNRQAEGRNVWTIVGCKEGGIVFTTWQSMVEGITPGDLIYQLHPRKVLAAEILNFVNWPFKENVA